MKTEEILNEISRISDLCFAEGGMYYTYTHFHRCAHINIKEFEYRNLSDEEVRRVENFVLSAVAENHSDKITDYAPKYSSELVEALNRFDKVRVSSFQQDDLAASIKIEAISENNGYLWALNWSID